MLTRCPACTTTFRVTPEQLKARAGKVRCGKCQTVFNALDSLVETLPDPAVPAHPVAPATARDGTPASSAAVGPSPQPPAPKVPADVALDILLEPPTTSAPAADQSIVEEIVLEALPSTPEGIRDVALNAGLVAARETTEVPGYDKWAEGAFAGTVAVEVPGSRPRWPFVLAALLLLVALAGQVAYQFRSELAVAAPSLRPMLQAACKALDCDIPLPRHSEFVSIEASDLQTDPARNGVLTLTATLKNRAPYAQAWPLLELTLTDVQDNALLRRVLQPNEYLPAKVDPTVFPPNADVAVHLWLETKDVVAAGYRLYVFYP